MTHPFLKCNSSEKMVKILEKQIWRTSEDPSVIDSSSAVFDKRQKSDVIQPFNCEV